MGREVRYKQEEADALMIRFDKAYNELKVSKLDVPGTIGYVQEKLELSDREVDIIGIELNDQFMKSRGFI